MANIRISTQIYENYSDTETPFWKCKGEHIFNIKNVDSNLVMYAPNIEEVLKTLVLKQSGFLYRFEYRDHEVLFYDDNENITAEMLEKELKLEK